MTAVDETNEPLNRVTLEEVRKLALPLETRIAAGNGLLNRYVSWTTVVYAEDPLDNKVVQSNEIILYAMNSASGKRATTDIDIVRWASDHAAAAVLMVESPSPNALAEAKAYSLPLLVLPYGARIRNIERSIVSLLVDRKGQVERQSTQIYRELTQITSRNEGMQKLVERLATLTNKAVIVQDKRLRVLHSSIHPQFVGYMDDFEQFLRKFDNLPVEFQDRQRVAEVDQPVQMQSLPVPGIARLVAPIVAKDLGRGFLSIIGFDNDLDDTDLLVAEHGAAACAIEMAKQKAVSETEKRLRGTFLDRLLLGDVTHQEAIKQGERFEHDMTATHIAVVLKWQDKEKSPSMRRLETIVNSVISSQRVKALVWVREREQEVLVFHAANPDNPIDNSLKLAEAFTAEIQRQVPHNKVAIGLGHPAKEISAWRTSYREAGQAQELGIRLQTDTPLFIGDLGVYQLILSLSDREKLTHFCEKTLGTLLEYDERQSADLIKTLEAFFTCHGNLSQTAEMLIVHRNTLLYRMNRINEIASIDLNRPETRLALHLALTIRRLMMQN